MSQLIALKHRIKTVQTFYKTTHAMRLISMSHRTRTKVLQTDFVRYKDIFNQTIKEYYLLSSLCSQSPCPVSHFVVIMTNKGVCGAFNNILAHYIKKDLELRGEGFSQARMYVVGRQGNELLKNMEFADTELIGYLALHTLDETVEQLALLIEKLQETGGVALYSNYAKSFFAQKPYISFIAQDGACTQDSERDCFIKKTQLRIFLKKICLDSLLAEYSARFIAMDFATKNAQELQEKLHLEYNKLRQMKITNELIDLSGAFIV
jgi:ATP synthase F1 gamma subunit